MLEKIRRTPESNELRTWLDHISCSLRKKKNKNQRKRTFGSLSNQFFFPKAGFHRVLSWTWQITIIRETANWVFLFFIHLSSWHPKPQVAMPFSLLVLIGIYNFVLQRLWVSDSYPPFRNLAPYTSVDLFVFSRKENSK